MTVLVSYWLLVFSPLFFHFLRRENCGVSPETPDSDPWPGAEHWWVSVQTSAVLNRLFINVQLWCFHTIVYLHDSIDFHHLNFLCQRSSEGLRDVLWLIRFRCPEPETQRSPAQHPETSSAAAPSGPIPTSEQWVQGNIEMTVRSVPWFWNILEFERWDFVSYRK